MSLLALKLARELDRRVAPLGLTVDDAMERLGGVRLVWLGDAEWGLWRLADRYPTAQQEVLDVLPKLPPPVVSRKSESQPLKEPSSRSLVAMGYVNPIGEDCLRFIGGT